MTPLTYIIMTAAGAALFGAATYPLLIKLGFVPPLDDPDLAPVKRPGVRKRKPRSAAVGSVESIANTVMLQLDQAGITGEHPVLRIRRGRNVNERRSTLVEAFFDSQTADIASSGGAGSSVIYFAGDNPVILNTESVRVRHGLFGHRVEHRSLPAPEGSSTKGNFTLSS